MQPTPAPVGIGLRQPHYAALFEAPPALGFVEVHAENFFADGGAPLAVLEQARAHWELSLHCVGLGLGSASGIDAWHLDRLQRLAERVQPARVSDHACFARAPLGSGTAVVVHGSDLLPLAFTPAALDILCANVQQVQERLRRPILVENLSAYLSFEDDEIPEPEFLATLARRTGCALLLDVNNLVVNALNARVADPVAQACAWVDALPRGCIGEIHLAGFTPPASPGALVIDDHATRVHDEVWSVYRHALRRLGPLPTLVEWDLELPPLAVLLDEAHQAAQLMAFREQAA
ncbi:MAG: DUF692 domain-containing protein [Aquabacterium sp.]|nr:MAG: DUF692 domain-containing protein [Aquabacterium sp.]